MFASASSPRVVTVTLNPAIDRTVTIPRFAAGVVNRAEQVADRPGGKGVNVAAALAGYGLPVAAAGFLGRDNAAVFEASFARLGIADHFVRVPGETRIGIKIVDPSAGETTDINFPGLRPSGPELATLLRELDRLAAGGAEWFVLAGSLPPGVSSGFYRDLISVVRGHGCRIALDTSGEPLREAMTASPDLLKPNVHELAELVGAELDSEDAVIAAARTLVADGVKLVTVSCGAQGAYFVTAEDVIVAQPPPITVGSTVGAGDAMVAGLVAAQLRGLALDSCARLATAFSLCALTRSNAEPGTRADVEPFLTRVHILYSESPR